MSVPDPNLLELEITESSIIQNVDYARSVLRELKAVGLRIALDDFGTSHSSLAQLKALPLDAVKFDRTFIAGIGEDSSSLALLKHVTRLARDLGLQTVAEGVETQAELDICRELGCDLIQGFYFHEPMAPNAFYSLLHGNLSGVIH